MDWEVTQVTSLFFDFSPNLCYNYSIRYKQEEMDMNYVSSGIGMGTALAMVISWSVNNSIGWAILHGILGWLYVIYFAITR